MASGARLGRPDHRTKSMESSNWAPEHSDALRDYFLKGMSFADIRGEINARFATTYTRNAIIGRAKRMRLAAVPRVQSPPIAPALPTAARYPEQSPAPPGVPRPP